MLVSRARLFSHGYELALVFTVGLGLLSITPAQSWAKGVASAHQYVQPTSADRNPTFDQGVQSGQKMTIDGKEVVFTGSGMNQTFIYKDTLEVVPDDLARQQIGRAHV